MRTERVLGGAGASIVVLATFSAVTASRRDASVLDGRPGDPLRSVHDAPRLTGTPGPIESCSPGG